MPRGPHSTVLPEATFATIPARSGLEADDALEWLIDVDVFEQAVSHTNWDSLSTAAAGMIMNGLKGSSAAQTDEINFDVILAKGTWDIEVMHAKDANRGIYTVQFDGSTKGTFDGYAAAFSANNLTSITGISVATSAKVRAKLLMATKNASATGYLGAIQHIQLRRTA